MRIQVHRDIGTDKHPDTKTYRETDIDTDINADIGRNRDKEKKYR